ncbi:hypothetical protein MMC10_010700 [Thelotrema lepadinum]|nr:hypothetical protein [Thelotrema lepadinum]
MKRAVIIGAGPCGLVALKEMLEGGHDAILYERSDRLGGVFASEILYPDLHLTISNWAMAYSDFPDPTRLHYSSAGEYLRYLQSYARHFGLERHIKYSSEVCNATLRYDRRWDLQVCQEEDSVKTVLEVQADALIVATGSNSLPKSLPPGLEGFDGRVIHSSAYDASFKHAVATEKLRVLVVGGGESGADVAAELGWLSPNVSVYLRRAPCIGPRYLNSKNEMKQVEANKMVDFPANGFLEAATTCRMSAAMNVYGYGFFRRVLWHTPVLYTTLSHLCLGSTSGAWVRNDQATYVTKNQRMAEAVQEGRIELLVSPSVSVQGSMCEFKKPDGTSEHRSFDAIVLCTGFDFSFQWLHLPSSKASISLNPRSWYLHCFPPDLGQSLFFVGFARPHQGGIPVMAEMLSRYIALLLRGDRKLPSDFAARARRDGEAEEEYYHLSPHVSTLVDYNAFLESVARRIGCEPRLPRSCVVAFNVNLVATALLLLQFCQGFHTASGNLGSWLTMFLWASSVVGFLTLHQGLLFKWWFFPHWAVWYRQRGPGAKPELLDGILERVNVWQATSVTSGFVLLLAWSVPAFYAQRLLSVVLFIIQAFQTSLGAKSDVNWKESLKPKLFALHDCLWRVEDLYLP